MNRRTLLRSALALPVLASAGNSPASAFVDCNVWLGEHPNRRLPWHTTRAIATNLHQRGVTQAWACTFDAILHKDLATANEFLTSECATTDGLILPVGTINPALPAWQSDLERCVNTHHMKIIRLLPNYHGYALDDPRFIELLELARSHGLLVQIVTQIEDERTQHPLLKAAPVDLKKLPRDARVMVLNANNIQILTALRGTSAIIDTAFIESVGGLGGVLKDWPVEQIVFGSHSPWFYWEANKLKLAESDLTKEQIEALTSRNALALLAVNR
jgi:hypothetical protein